MLVLCEPRSHQLALCEPTEFEGRQTRLFCPVYPKVVLSSSCPHFVNVRMAFSMGDSLDKMPLTTSVAFLCFIYLFIAFVLFKI